MFPWVKCHMNYGKIDYIPLEASVSSESGTDSSTKYPDCFKSGLEDSLGKKNIEYSSIKSYYL